MYMSKLRNLLGNGPKPHEKFDFMRTENTETALFHYIGQ